MSVDRYVCLSDLHLGALNSVLTCHDYESGTLAPERTNETLRLFALSLKRLVRTLWKEPATLVLLGDCVEMAFTPTEELAKAFQTFVRALFDGDAEGRVFRDTVRCIPGNHDHHLWQSTKEDHFFALFAKLGAVEPGDPEATRLPRPRRIDPEATCLLNPQPIDSTLLTRLMRDALKPDFRGSVSLAYPNLGLVTPVGKNEGPSRLVILHHGHFIEPIYRAASTFNSALHGIATAETVTELERQNGTWIDFLWSRLGSSGALGDTAQEGYLALQDPAASNAMAHRLSVMALEYLRRNHGVSDLAELDHSLTVGGLVRSMVDATLGQYAELERFGYHRSLSRDSIEQLRWYLEKPIMHQLEEAKMCGATDRAVDAATTFVFGHTHKPFEDRLAVAGWSRPLQVFNSGGWLVNEPGLTSVQGAAAIFIDEHLNVASLRLFDDGPHEIGDGSSASPVRAMGSGGPEDTHNTLLESMRKALEKHTWEDFSVTVHREIRDRGAIVRSLFFDPRTVTGG